MSYYELWAIIGKWRKEFSTGEFSRTFYSPDPNKVLYDMAKKGMLERIGIGKYRVRDSSEYLFKKYDISKAYEFLGNSKLPYALTGVDAVYVWTRGGYNVDRFFGFYPIHIKVGKTHVSRWEKLLAENGWKAFLSGEKPKETLFGLFFILYPVGKLVVEKVDSLKVDPLKDTVEFCIRNVFSFEPALEMLNEQYHLGLRVKYREARTNM
ncbi:MAG: hypothetical protein ACRD38_07865 [Nitrososphaerales archaeon]